MAIISRKYNFVGGTTVDPLQMNAELNQLINAHNDHDQNKVDKIAGKGLSTNDFTDQYKSDVDDNTLARHTHGNKTLLDTYTQSETDLSDAVTKKHFHSNKTVLDQILGVTTVLGNDPTKVPSEKAVAEEIANHVEDNNNPHAVTKSQVGLGNVDNTSDINKPISTAMQAALDGKVDKVTGKGLSTYDYDDTEKDKVRLNTLARHSHSNKTLLDTYTQSNDDLAGAVANRHTHSNKSVLDGIVEVTQTLGNAADKVPSEKAVVDAMAVAGRGIVSIARTSGTGAAGTTDTYTVTYTDGTTTTFQIYNGADGAKGDKGDKGDKGEPGLKVNRQYDTYEDLPVSADIGYMCLVGLELHIYTENGWVNAGKLTKIDYDLFMHIDGGLFTDESGVEIGESGLEALQNHIIDANTHANLIIDGMEV